MVDMPVGNTGLAGFCLLIDMCVTCVDCSLMVSVKKEEETIAHCCHLYSKYTTMVNVGFI